MAVMIALVAFQFPRHYGKQDLVIFPVMLPVVLGVNYLKKRTRRKP